MPRIDLDDIAYVEVEDTPGEEFSALLTVGFEDEAEASVYLTAEKRSELCALLSKPENPEQK